MMETNPDRHEDRKTYADEVTYGERTIAFDVVRTDRKTLGIHVHPAGNVEVRVPLTADAEDVRARVERRARWIVRNQRRFAELVQARPEKEYVSGETHRYLGRQYRLKVIPVGEGVSIEGGGSAHSSEGACEGVRLVGRYFVIHTHHPDDPAHTRKLLDRWYREKAGERLRERFERGCELMRKYGVTPPPLQIRKMERRWGSCTPTGRVLLNPLLILAPTACIDYVVIHELCHLKHPHHGPEFYDLLSRVMPDWQDRKRRLDEVQ